IKYRWCLIAFLSESGCKGMIFSRIIQIFSQKTFKKIHFCNFSLMEIKHENPERVKKVQFGSIWGAIFDEIWKILSKQKYKRLKFSLLCSEKFKKFKGFH
nr:hypothetical protein [Bacteroidaceae bacterium]